MCATCGCSESLARVLVGGDVQDHPGHEHGPPEHGPPEHGGQVLTLEQKVLAKNDELARHNRESLEHGGILALNLMSSPGSGKTTLLERTIREVSPVRHVCVVEGDQETSLDADRIRATGCDVVQVNTGSGCHLDADMLHRAVHALDPPRGSLLFVENVGNLVCPSMFDLGERAKVVVISVTEGQDKPLKYPYMFSVADLVLVNKTDLLPYVDFDVAVCTENARWVNPDVEVLGVSATTGAGMGAWYSWLDGQGDWGPTDPEPLTVV